MIEKTECGQASPSAVQLAGAALNGPPEPRSADFQSAVSPISNRLPCKSSSALYYSEVSQAGSRAIQQIGNLRYSGFSIPKEAISEVDIEIHSQ